MFNLSNSALINNVPKLVRTLLDIARIFLVWVVSYLLKWEGFGKMTMLGFLFVLVGNLIYAEILKVPGFTNKLKGSYLKRSFIVQDDDMENDDIENT